MIAPALPSPPWDVSDQALTFLLQEAPLRKVRLIQDAVHRVNAKRFHGAPTGTMQLVRIAAERSHRTRHGRPLWTIWAAFQRVSSSVQITSEIDPDLHGAVYSRAELCGAVDFNCIPLGCLISPKARNLD